MSVLQNLLRPTDLPTYRPTDLPTYRLTDRSKRIPFPTRFLLIMLAVLIILPGCEKENTIISSDLKKDATSEKFKAVNGELHFVNAETFRKDAIEVMNLPEPQFLEWEKRIGYKSLKSWVNEAYQILEQAKTQAEFNQWKIEYRDIMEFNGSDVQSKIQDPYALHFSNREGIFHIGKKLVKAFHDKNVIILDGDRTKIEKSKSLNISSIKEGIVIDSHTDSDDLVLRSGCVNLETDRVHDSKRVVYRFKIDKRTFGSYYYTLVEVSEFAKKKNIWGNWVNDEQKLKWMECSWQVTDNYNINHTVTEQVHDSDDIKVHGLSLFLDCQDDTPHASYVTPTFNYRKGKATSDLLDWNKYAVQCCGFPSAQCPDADG